MDHLLANNLQACLDLLEAGTSVEECLAAYPAQRAELEPLLRTVTSLARLPAPPLPAAARVDLERRMLERLAPPGGGSSPPSPTALLAISVLGIPAWLLGLVVLVLVLLVALVL